MSERFTEEDLERVSGGDFSNAKVNLRDLARELLEARQAFRTLAKAGRQQADRHQANMFREHQEWKAGMDELRTQLEQSHANHQAECRALRAKLENARNEGLDLAKRLCRFALVDMHAKTPREMARHIMDRIDKAMDEKARPVLSDVAATDRAKLAALRRLVRAEARYKAAKAVWAKRQYTFPQKDELIASRQERNEARALVESTRAMEDA